MRVPSVFEFVLLVLASYRSWRLVAVDVITRPLRVRVTHRSETPGSVYIDKHGVIGGSYRARTDEFVHCPWCLGSWVTIVWWVAWLEWPRFVVGVAVVAALCAVVGLVARNLDP